jgi:glycosyltransferase involved in cell wall biosynthesis
MRVLHVVKTSDGATWAALQAQQLADLGVDVHVALPSTTHGAALPLWDHPNITTHSCPLDWPTRRPWLIPDRLRAARALVRAIQPDIIHSHFVTTTLTLRFALGPSHPTPRIFQVPGPLHLEHAPFRLLDLSSASPNDSWIASSHAIRRYYLRAGVPPSRVPLSYYGIHISPLSPEALSSAQTLRHRLGISPSTRVIGNISWMYPPKRYLGQRIGLKAHEHLIPTLAHFTAQHSNTIGLLAGGGWNGAASYERSLRSLAQSLAPGRILLPGPLPSDAAKSAWAAFQCAVHIPLSENCGGVIEPLLANVPVIARDIGGLPEVICDGITGRLIHDTRSLPQIIHHVLNNPSLYADITARGQALVRTMFDVRRTSAEVFQYYQALLSPSTPPPPPFDRSPFLR